ncbi:MAG: sialate O-acetylesterase [Thiolinea sp.]
MNTVRVFSVILLLLTLLPPAALQAGERIYLLAGQSNMMGRGKTFELPPAYRKTPANVHFYYQGRERGLAQFAFFGPEVSFAHEVARAFPQDTHTLIKLAATGSSIQAWQPEQALYKGLLRQIGFSLEQAQPRVDAILWMQGESDARQPALAAQYTPRLTHLIQSLRADLHSPNSLFLIGEINPEDEAFSMTAQVRASQQQVQRALPGTLLVSAEGLGKLPDRVHYDARGQMELGKRFAQAYIQRQRHPAQ